MAALLEPLLSTTTTALPVVAMSNGTWKLICLGPDRYLAVQARSDATNRDRHTVQANRPGHLICHNGSGGWRDFGRKMVASPPGTRPDVELPR